MSDFPLADLASRRQPFVLPYTDVYTVDLSSEREREGEREIIRKDIDLSRGIG